MTVLILGSALSCLMVAAILVLSFLKFLRRLLPRLSLPWRFGLQNLTRRPRLGTGQILAFGLTLTAMLISLLVRTELIQAWRNQLPDDAPNHFALNLFESDLPAFRVWMEKENLSTSAFYPIVRGRLTTINGVDVHRIASKESQGEGAINRDLSLTWSEFPPEDNRILQGQWWSAQTAPLHISVEAKLAESLKISLGDELSFTLGNQELKAVVDNLRSVRWDSMRPNFYVIFSPGSLQNFPATWLTSFHVAPAQKPALARLVKAFPAVTILEVDQLLDQFQNILREISLAIEFVLIFALVAGFTVLFAAVRASVDERIRENALLRTLGASRGLLRKSLGLEFAALGLLSGFLAAASSDVIAWALFSRIFDLAPRFHWEMWLITPAIGALVIGVSGYWHTRGNINARPAEVLREV